MSDHTSSTKGAANEMVADIGEATANEGRFREAAGVKLTTEEIAAQQAAHTNALHLGALAANPNRGFPPGTFDSERRRMSRQRLGWLSSLYWCPPTYLPRTWGYTILRTTYDNDDSDAAVDAALQALNRFMRAIAKRECQRVTESLQDLQRSRQLPAGVPDTADTRPSDECYVRRFVTELVQDRDEVENAAVPQACAYFRRWSLARWEGEEHYFSAASPRLKSAILFDAETVAQLQGLNTCELGESGKVWAAGKEFWVKMVEAEPKELHMKPGLTDCFRVEVGLLEDYWFERDRAHPAREMLWKRDDRFPGDWFFSTG